MKTTPCLFWMVTCLSAGMLFAEEAALPAFTAKPAAARAGGQVKISFTVSIPTDVEIAVVDKDGQVIRHLAAGGVGSKSPPPLPLQPGLAQDLAWDEKDDAGNPAPAGCRIRVGLGTTARLGKVLMDDRGLAWSPRAATVGPDGLVYVLEEHAATKSTFLLEAYTQDGKYVRTVMPYPANLPSARLAGLPRAALPDGRILPAVHHSVFRDLYPESTGMRPQRMPITSKGWIVLVNASKTHNAGNGVYQTGAFPHRIMTLDTAGGMPRESYIGPLTSAEKITQGLCWLALSPDEKWIYTSGQLKGNAADDGSNSAHNVIYRLGWDDRTNAVPFIGELFKSGSDESHLSAPRGIDTDSQGRLFVCDWGNNRVAVFDADGKWAGKIDVEAPDQVAVERKGGAVYVLTRKKAGKVEESKLLKFPGVGKPAAAEIDVGMPYCTMTLDAADKGVNLWLARTFGESAQSKRGVERVEDRDGKLSAPVEVIRHRETPDLFQIAASPVSDDVFVHGFSDHSISRLDGRTGEIKTFPKIKGQDVGVGPEGQLVVFRFIGHGPDLGELTQFDRDGNPLPFKGVATNKISRLPSLGFGHNDTGSKGFSMSPGGDVVTIGTVDGVLGVYVFGTDGARKGQAGIRGLGGADASPCMDRQGNLYVASTAKRPDELMPKVFDLAKPPSPQYPAMYGSVLKFPPEGGTVHTKPVKPQAGEWPPAGSDKMLRLVSGTQKTEKFAEGAQWSCGGFTVVPHNLCHCYTSRFGLDAYGRAFIPDVGLFSVLVVDSAGNPVMRFGDYGNADSAGKGSAIPAPEIPMSWPAAVSVGKSGIYVSDFINRRVLRVDLTHAAEESVPVP